MSVGAAVTNRLIYSKRQTSCHRAWFKPCFSVLQSKIKVHQKNPPNKKNTKQKEVVDSRKEVKRRRKRGWYEVLRVLRCQPPRKLEVLERDEARSVVNLQAPLSHSRLPHPTPEPNIHFYYSCSSSWGDGRTAVIYDTFFRINFQPRKFWSFLKTTVLLFFFVCLYFLFPPSFCWKQKWNCVLHIRRNNVEVNSKVSRHDLRLDRFNNFLVGVPSILVVMTPSML